MSIDPHPVTRSPARRARAAILRAAFVALAAPAALAATPAPDLEAVAAEVRAAETAFARTMAERKLADFSGFVAEDAVFRGRTLQRGRAAVVEAWRGFFAEPAAPFSWGPDAVTVSEDGRLALSTGPVRDAGGHVVSRFTSIWRRDADGRWRVIVDQGVDACECAAPR